MHMLNGKGRGADCCPTAHGSVTVVATYVPFASTQTRSAFKEPNPALREKNTTGIEDSSPEEFRLV